MENEQNVDELFNVWFNSSNKPVMLYDIIKESYMEGYNAGCSERDRKTIIDSKQCSREE